jgi:hypothetical protein
MPFVLTGHTGSGSVDRPDLRLPAIRDVQNSHAAVQQSQSNDHQEYEGPDDQVTPCAAAT